MRVWMALLVAAACHNSADAPVAPSSTADQDALWKLAPSDATFGIVASPRALAMIEHAWSDVRALMASTPELAPALVKLGAQLGTPDLSFASFGSTAAKGAALFMIDPNKGIAIVPLGDRDIVAAAPSSPLANEVKAGFGGMLVQTGALAALAAVAIPAVEDYMTRAQESDVALQLGRIGRMLQRMYGETQAFPIGDSALLPAGQCCGQAGNKCVADPLAFGSDKIWNQIGFAVDQPIADQFHYHSDDGKVATVQAVGEPACDGKQAAYTLRMTIDPTTRGATYAIEPPHGTY